MACSEKVRVPMDGELRAFIDRVIVPALVARFLAEQAAGAKASASA